MWKWKCERKGVKVWKETFESESVKGKVWKCERKRVKVKVWKERCKSVKENVWKWKCESVSVIRAGAIGLTMASPSGQDHHLTHTQLLYLTVVCSQTCNRWASVRDQKSLGCCCNDRSDSDINFSDLSLWYSLCLVKSSIYLRIISYFQTERRFSGNDV